MNDNLVCPNCDTAGMQPFYAVDNVPVHSVLLMHSREQALTYPTGKITLAACEQCGFISNGDFDASLLSGWRAQLLGKNLVNWLLKKSNVNVDWQDNGCWLTMD